MPFELPSDPRTERRAMIARWISFACAAVLVALVTYFAYVGWEGSAQLANAPAHSADCRTPAALGWEYEAINYDIATDADLATEADPRNCAAQGAAPGRAVVGPGGVGLAGWYVPAATGTGPTGPTVVVAHGYSSNKSEMLGRAAVLHDDYNLVLFDFRNHGQSQAADTTQGVREAGDLLAILDWLEESKGPEQVAVLGVSMGGASALNAAVRDERIDAVIVESTHATLVNAVRARIERAGYPLSVPASWAALLGALFRTGVDMSAADPVQAIALLDERPVLIIDAGHDTSIGERDGQELLEAARAAGSPATLEVCEEAPHGASAETCAEPYASWVLGFLDRALSPQG